VVEVGFDGLRDELEHVALLLAAGFDGCQQRLHEAAAAADAGRRPLLHTIAGRVLLLARVLIISSITGRVQVARIELRVSGMRKGRR